MLWKVKLSSSGKAAFSTVGTHYCLHNTYKFAMFSDFICHSVNSRADLLQIWLFWICPNVTKQRIYLAVCFVPLTTTRIILTKWWNAMFLIMLIIKPKEILQSHMYISSRTNFSCMHVKQQFIPFLFQSGLEGKLIQQNDSWICNGSVCYPYLPWCSTTGAIGILLCPLYCCFSPFIPYQRHA